MICKKCGKKIEYGHIACPFCGELVDFTSRTLSGINWGDEETPIDKPSYDISPIPDYKAVTPVRHDDVVHFNWAAKPYNQTKTPEKENVDVDYYIAKADRAVVKERNRTGLIIKIVGAIIMGILSYFAAKDKELNSYENRSKQWQTIDKALENYNPYEEMPEDLQNIMDPNKNGTLNPIQDDTWDELMEEGQNDSDDIQEDTNDTQEAAENTQEEENSEIIDDIQE